MTVLPDAERLQRQSLELERHRPGGSERGFDVIGPGRTWLLASQLSNADQHGELVVHPILQHRAQLSDQSRSLEPRMPPHRPDQESLQPNKEGQRRRPGVPHVRQGEDQSEQHAERREEQLEMLGDLSLEGIMQLGGREQFDLQTNG